MILRSLLLGLLPTGLLASPYADGINYDEVSDLVGQAMAAAGHHGTVEMSQLRSFPACQQTPTVSPRGDTWRTVELRCEGPDAWNRAVRTSARMTEPAPKRRGLPQPAGPDVLVLTESLSRGAVIEPRHLTLKPIQDGTLDGLMTDPTSVIGRTLTVNLGQGRPLLARHLEHSWLITEGSPVAIVYDAGGMTILATGIAAENGQRGQIIAVRNLGSDRLVKAIVTERNKVTVAAKMN